MAAIATALFGPAPKRSGSRLLWPCPFHDDHDPSLQIDPAERRWKCWPCDLGGDAPALVMRLKGVVFPEAVRVVAELAGISAPSRNPTALRPPARADPARPSMSPDRAAEKRPDGPTGLPPADALALIDEAAERLWKPEGRAVLAYLESRGLTLETIKAARLGWAEKIRMPKRDGRGTWPLSGITIPWIDSGRLTRIKVRRLGLFRGAKYIESFSDSPSLYPSMATIRPPAPLVIVEGEFDALLLGQELTDLASVVTTGSSSSRPEGSTYLAMMRCPTWFIALDADEAGDRAAADWPARAVRVRPPEPCKDWGELHASGFNRIRYLWGGILRRPGTPWEELARRRWGPGLTDPAPGIVVDRPARGGDA
jgi:DNA primase